MVSLAVGLGTSATGEDFASGGGNYLAGFNLGYVCDPVDKL